MKTHKNGKEGFTLVELMIVVAIVGVLAAIALPQFERFTTKTRRAEGIVLLKSFYTAELAYFSAHDGFALNYNGGSPTGVPPKLGFAAASTPKFYNLNNQSPVPRNTNPLIAECGDFVCSDNQSFYALLEGQLDADDRADMLLIGTVAVPGIYETPGEIAVLLVTGNDDVFCHDSGCL